MQRSLGNAYKDSRRCARCGTDNWLGRLPRLRAGERRIAFSCHACGAWIILDRAAWNAWHQEG